MGGFIVAVVDSTATLVNAIGALLPWVVVFVLLGWYRLRRRRRARLAASPAPAAK